MKSEQPAQTAVVSCGLNSKFQLGSGKWESEVGRERNINSVVDGWLQALIS